MILFETEEYLSADLKLYNYFKIKFDEKLQQFGDERMKLEMIKLKNQNENMKVSMALNKDYFLYK